jgi:hypothetical protein
MKYILSISIILFFCACGNGYTPPQASINFNTENYISQTDENNHTIAKDLRQNLLFINSSYGCKALHGNNDDALINSRLFCENLTFFGFSDWRIPTLKEIQSFEKGMHNDGLVPYYTFPECKRITGIKTDGTLGAINSHNVSPKFEEVPLKLPAGLRCTRVNDIP